MPAKNTGVPYRSGRRVKPAEVEAMRRPRGGGCPSLSKAQLHYLRLAVQRMELPNCSTPGCPCRAQPCPARGALQVGACPTCAAWHRLRGGRALLAKFSLPDAFAKCFAVPRGPRGMLKHSSQLVLAFLLIKVNSISAPCRH